jgi:sorbitol/mannitol transport system permease protein
MSTRLLTPPKAGSELPHVPSKLGRNISSAGLTLLTWIVVGIFFFPVLWMLITGFKTESQAATRPPTLFFVPTLEQFHGILDRGVVPFLLNSLTVSFVTVAVVIILAIPAAYALAIRPVKKWRDVLFFFLSTRMLPVAAAIAPIYILARDLHLLDTTLVLILLNLVTNLPIAIWMLRSFLLEIPKEVLEAATVDGAGFTRSMFSIIMPMLGPGIGACALICFIFVWNEFFLAVNLTSTVAATLPVFLVGFITSEGQFWAQLSAAATVCAVPVIIAGWVAQDKLVRGLTLGAVK